MYLYQFQSNLNIICIEPKIEPKYVNLKTTIKWTNNLIESGLNSITQYDGNLEIAQLDTIHKSTYTCLSMINNEIIKTKTFNLYLLQKPVIIENPKNQSIVIKEQKEENVDFECKFEVYLTLKENTSIINEFCSKLNVQWYFLPEIITIKNNENDEFLEETSSTIVQFYDDHFTESKNIWNLVFHDKYLYNKKLSKTNNSIVLTSRYKQPLIKNELNMGFYKCQIQIQIQNFDIIESKSAYLYVERK